MRDKRIGEGAWSVVVNEMGRFMMPDAQIIVSGFPSRDLAIEYARRRTRASVEEQRKDVLTPEDLRDRFYLYGEDCAVVGEHYSGSSELDFFVTTPASAEECDWSAIELEVRTGGGTAPRVVLPGDA